MQSITRGRSSEVRVLTLSDALADPEAGCGVCVPADPAQFSNQVAYTVALRTLSIFRLADIYYSLPLFPFLQPVYRAVPGRIGPEIWIFTG